METVIGYYIKIFAKLPLGSFVDVIFFRRAFVLNLLIQRLGVISDKVYS